MPYTKRFFVELSIVKPKPFARPYLLISANASSRVRYVFISESSSLFESKEVEGYASAMLRNKWSVNGLSRLVGAIGVTL
jgi:hypothetical protein